MSAIVAPDQIRQGFSSAVPEPGQLVEVRRRQWVVGDVQGASIDRETEAASWQHLVNLTSIDEDALGEELDVVWEIEPGARVLEKAGLPRITGHDDADRLEAFLDAVSWGAATNADRSFLQAPFRSGVTIEDYQLDPLVRAIDMARVNLLIADDVGLGKTIEAGLVIQELLVRHRARTVLIVCPASLQVKWQMEMHEKFGLEFRIVDTDYIRRLRRERGIHANPWTSFPRLVTSMDWMKSGEGLRLMKDVLPPHATYPRKFDVLVVDEAHNVAPAAAAQYALESQRTRLIRAIAPHFEHRLFLSATPHNGYQESFTSLLELLDDQRFARSVMPDERQLQRVMVRRLKTDLVDADGKPIYPRRELMPLEVEYTPEEREMHRLLREYTESRARSVGGTRSEFGADFVHKLLKKRLFSSPAAFAATLSKHRESLERGPATKSGKAMEDRILRKAILRAEEDWADDGRLEVALDDATREAGATAPTLTTEQRDMLNRLGRWAESAKNKPDSKARAILNWLDAYLKTDGHWNDRRVILFTEYRATHAWLHQILASHGYGSDRIAILHGGMDGDERERIKAAFQAHPDVSPVRILLATDAASEGIDLQNHCNYLIHVEIPWNPNVMEQRNGRIDRHGQKHDRVYVWHPVGKGFAAETVAADPSVGELEGDHEYLMRAVLKVNAIREDLGSVGPVIAQQIEEAMLGRRDRLDTRVAEEKAERARRFVAAARKLKERVAKLHQRLLEARNDFHLSPDRISRAVRVGMELADLPALKPASLPGAPEGSVFDVPWLPGSWGRATAGLEHPHTGARRPITFDHEVAKGRDDVVLAHLNHRLVQMCLRLLRAEIWALEDLKKLHRVTVRAVSDPGLRVPAVAVWSRLVITGGNHHRLRVSQAGIDAAARFNDISVVWSADRGCGLTEVMNAIHSPDTNDERIVELRSLPETIDAEIAAAYGWHGLDLEHGFRQIQGATNNDRWRHAVSEATRAEILNRLSELNRERYEEEVARGLSENATRPSSARAPRTSRGAEESTQATLDLGMPSAATASAGDSVVYAASANESDYLEAAESRARYTAVSAAAILDFLRSARGWHAKSDIVAATGLSDGQWNTLIADLVARGLVERQGERRGARYRLVE